MAIRFERREKHARYLDPRAGFAETSIACEIRRDPSPAAAGASRTCAASTYKLRSLAR